MNKLGVVALALGLALAVAWWLLRSDDVPAAPDAAPAPVAEAPPAAAEVAGEAAPEPQVELRRDAGAPGADDPGPDELRGRVVMAGTRAPVTGAEVRLQRCDADAFSSLDPADDLRVSTLTTTASAADGTFRFAVARSQLHRLEVLAAGCARTTASQCTGGSEVVIEVAPAAIVEGIVRYCGVGVGDVPVRIVVAGAATELAVARTAPNGTFWFDGVPPTEAVYVQALSPAHEQKWRALELQPGARHRVELDLLRGKVMQGLVVDAANGFAIADAEVADSPWFERSVRTGRDGRFALAAARVHVRAKGFASASISSKGDTTEVALVRGAQVRGRIVSATGTPLAAAQAILAANLGGSGQGPRGWQFATDCDRVAADVDAEGRFVATCLRVDQHYWLHVRSDGCGARVYALGRKLVDGETLDVGDVVLQAAAGIEGSVVDAGGAPIANLQVWLRGANADARAWLEPGLKPEAVHPWMCRLARTDARGRFCFPGLAAGEFELIARRGHTREARAVVAVRDGAVRSGVELVFGDGAAIDGVVSLPAGGVLGDAVNVLRVRAWRAGTVVASASLGSDGSFRLEGLQEGDFYVVLLDHVPAGWAASPRAMAAGTVGVRLLVGRSSFVAGRVVGPQGEGRRARVYAQAIPGGPLSLSFTDADGSFRLEVPADFAGTVGARWPGNEYVEVAREDVKAGETGLVLRLELPTEKNTARQTK